MWVDDWMRTPFICHWPNHHPRPIPLLVLPLIRLRQVGSDKNRSVYPCQQPPLGIYTPPASKRKFNRMGPGKAGFNEENFISRLPRWTILLRFLVGRLALSLCYCLCPPHDSRKRGHHKIDMCCKLKLKKKSTWLSISKIDVKRRRPPWMT